jgi:hypothetical protein
MREEEDGGGGVGRTIYPAIVIYSTSGNLCQISAVHGKVEMTELILAVHVSARGRRGVHYAW